MTRAFCLVVLFCFIFSAPAIGAINHFNDSTVMIKPFIESATYGFDLKNFQNSTAVRWQPNTTGTTGIEIFLNGMIGIGLAGRGVTSNQDRINKGETVYDDWRFVFNTPSYQVSLNYENFRGFYVNNTSDIDPTLSPPELKIQAPNMVVQNFDLGLNWIFSPESFSLEAALNQTSRQEESGGSWLAGVSYSETDLSNDASLVPSKVQAQFGVDQNVTNARFHNFLLKGGYGFSLILMKSWFATIAGELGVGPQWAEYSNGTDSKQFGQGMSHTEILIALGYNGEKYFASTRVKGESVTYRTEALSISSSLYSFRFAFGARF